MTAFEILHIGEEMLRDSGVEEYRSDAWILFSYAFKMSRTDFICDCMSDMPSSDEAAMEVYKKALNLRISGVPVQYITGEQYFYGRRFLVDERVLIPRQDTETLVEHALELMQRYMSETDKVCCGNLLDLCTGSGCIAVTLALELPWSRVDAADISEDALSVAKENARLNGAEVSFYCGDLFGAVPDGSLYNLITANPPYIRTDVIDTLDREVAEHEPRLALDGSEDGLAFYRRIASEAGRYLNPGGFIAFEIGYDQGPEVKKIMETCGFYDVQVYQDLAGLDRVAAGRRLQEKTENRPLKG